MQYQQIPIQIEDLQNKILIVCGDDFDEHFLNGIKDHLKRKGIVTAGIVMIPPEHYMCSLDKKEAIDFFKKMIVKLEETT